MQLGDHEFHHNHDISDPGERRTYHSLTPEAVAKIIEMTRHHATPGMIRTELDLHAGPDAFYATRRATLMEQRQNQVEALFEAVQHWRGWEWAFVPPDDTGEFRGFLAVQVQVVEHEMCRDTLGMDDTSCTNFFELPVSAIITPDPNSKTQLVAFAILRDQGADALIEFLRFVRTHMSEQAPKAFVIDRAAAEKLAVETVFPESYICFCLMHVFRNLEQKCGKHHELVKGFWPAMRGNFLDQDKYRILLYRTFETNRHRPEKKKLVNCVARVCNDWVHIATYITSRYTSMDETARNEGWNGTIKVFLDHHRMELLYVANAYRLMGEMAFRTSQHMLTKFIPCGILSRRDQHFVGRVALELLLDQMTYLLDHRRAARVKDPEYTGKCCTCHVRYPGFPCCHLLRDRYTRQKQQTARGQLKLRYFLQDDFTGTPLLALNDIPRRWHRLLTGPRPAASHAPAFVRPAKAPLDPAAARAFFKRMIDQAEYTPALLREIDRCRGRLEPLIPEGAPVDPIPGGVVDGEGNPEAFMDELRDASPDGFVDGEGNPDGGMDAGPVICPHDPPLRHEPGAPREFPVRSSPLHLLKKG
jgi:hypothetical protein